MALVAAVAATAGYVLVPGKWYIILTVIAGVATGVMLETAEQSICQNRPSALTERFYVCIRAPTMYSPVTRRQSVVASDKSCYQNTAPNSAGLSVDTIN